MASQPPVEGDDTITPCANPAVTTRPACRAAATANGVSCKTGRRMPVSVTETRQPSATRARETETARCFLTRFRDRGQQYGREDDWCTVLDCTWHSPINRVDVTICMRCAGRWKAEIGAGGAMDVRRRDQSTPRCLCRGLSQDTYWCHTVSVSTAFSPNRIGEYDSYCRTNCCIYDCTPVTGVRYTSEVAQCL